jgi:hypothetical protein
LSIVVSHKFMTIALNCKKEEEKKLILVHVTYITEKSLFGNLSSLLSLRFLLEQTMLILVVI